MELTCGWHGKYKPYKPNQESESFKLAAAEIQQPPIERRIAPRQRHHHEHCEGSDASIRRDNPPDPSAPAGHAFFVFVEMAAAPSPDHKEQNHEA